MHIDLDILVCAAIAVVIFWRLWSILGTRNEDEIERPNPFAARPPFRPADPVDVPFTPPSPFLLQPTLPPSSLAGALAQIQTFDPIFDERVFLQQARADFTTIVEAYASGDLASIAPLLAPPLLAHFQQATDVRRSEGQSAQSRVLSIQDAETTAARTEGTQAFITVTFTSTQENTLRDARGIILGGGQAEEATDIWTFTRDTKTPDSKWIVTDTRG